MLFQERVSCRYDEKLHQCSPRREIDPFASNRQLEELKFYGCIICRVEYIPLGRGLEASVMVDYEILRLTRTHIQCCGRGRDDSFPGMKIYNSDHSIFGHAGCHPFDRPFGTVFCGNTTVPTVDDFLGKLSLTHVYPLHLPSSLHPRSNNRWPCD